MVDRPKQEQFKFSLSVRDKHTREVRKIVQFLKRRGILSQAVRDGLRLINDLRRGNTKVLLEMFPDIGEKIHPPPPSGNGDLERQIADLKRIVLEQGSISAPPMNYPQAKQLGKGIGSKSIAMPTFDDDDDDGSTIILNQAAFSSNADTAMAALLKIGF